MSEKSKIIFVVGPTAGGKTGLGAHIAKILGGEVVSADSMQIYKGMHIASAAAEKEEMQGVPHHLLEFLPYGEKFTVFDYLKIARETINDILSRKKVPVIVGGTGLYVNAIADNIELTDVKTDFIKRKELEQEFDRVGGKTMLDKLRLLDSASAENLHENDKRRIVRAFEIYETTGKTKSQQNILSRKNESPYDSLIIGLNYKDREKLYERINARVDIMLQKGLLDEAKEAFNNKSDRTDGAVQAIGHKEFFPYFKGEISLGEAIETLKRQTRRYAKRQLTWFNQREDIKWIYPDICDAVSECEKILESEGYIFEKQ